MLSSLKTDFCVWCQCTPPPHITGPQEVSEFLLDVVPQSSHIKHWPYLQIQGWFWNQTSLIRGGGCQYANVGITEVPSWGEHIWSLFLSGHVAERKADNVYVLNSSWKYPAFLENLGDLLERAPQRILWSYREISMLIWRITKKTREASLESLTLTLTSRLSTPEASCT